MANVIVLDLLIKNICIGSDLKHNFRYPMSNSFFFLAAILDFAPAFEDMNWVPPYICTDTQNERFYQVTEICLCFACFYPLSTPLAGGLAETAHDPPGCPSLNFLQFGDLLVVVGVPYCTCIFKRGAHQGLVGLLFGSDG